MTESKPYWICCGDENPAHNGKCIEARVGHPERCRFGTQEEHTAWGKARAVLSSEDQRQLYLLTDYKKITREILNFIEAVKEKQFGKWLKEICMRENKTLLFIGGMATGAAIVDALIYFLQKVAQ